MLPNCQCCRERQISYQLHDETLGHVMLCRKCFVKMDGRLVQEASTIENHYLDLIYEKHKGMIDRVKGVLRADEDAQFKRMWDMDGSHIKEGAVRR